MHRKGFLSLRTFFRFKGSLEITIMSQASVIRKKAKASLPINVINLKAKNMLSEISEEEEEQQQQWENHVTVQGKVVAYGKNQQISPVLDQLINYTYTLAYQLKLDKKYSCFHFFFSHATILGKSTKECTCQCLSNVT